MKFPIRRLTDRHLVEVLRGAALAFALRITGAVFSFALNVLIARALGPDGMGGYFLAFTTMSIVALIGRLGMDNVLMRHGATATSEQQWGQLRWLASQGVRLALLATLGLSIALAMAGDFLAREVFHDATLANPIRIMALAAVPVAGLNLYAQLFKSLKWSGIATLVQGVAVPALVLTLLALVVWQFAPSLNALASIYLAASVVVCASACWWFYYKVPNAASEPGEHTLPALFKSAFPLLLVASINLVMTWTDTMLLGAWVNTEAVGLYNAAARTAGLTAFVLMAVNTIAAPKYATMHAQGEFSALASLARRSTALMIVCTLPALLLFVAFPEPIMAIFGEEFRDSGTVLTILALGQAANVATGSVGYLLMMTGHEKIMRNNVAFSALVNLLLNCLLIPGYGAVGAAIATASSLVLMNLISTLAVRKKLGFYAFPFFTGLNQS